MELVYAVAGGVAFLLLLHLFASRERKKPEPDPKMAELASYIDTSLKGYPDRHRQKSTGETYGWTCHSRLFTIQIQLEQKRPGYRFRAYFFRDMPYRFVAKRSITGNLKIVSSSGALTKKLIGEREIGSLLEKLEFYNQIEVNKYGVAGSKSFGSIEDLSGWHAALGCTITFARFLLNYSERKVPTASREAFCPYCRGELVETDRVVSCGECRTRHHQDCWNETERCSVYGCSGKSELQI